MGTKITVRLPDDLESDIEGHPEYCTKSGFVRDALREKLDREPAERPD